MRWVRGSFVSCCGVMLVGLTVASAPAEPQVWTGLTKSFTKPGNADWLLPEYQDRITPHVWFTRAASAGLFNIAVEEAYDSSSPADTRWATGFMPANSDQEITASNYANLTFTNWTAAYGGQGQLASAITAYDAVVHLVVDDIYLDLRFTDWGARGGAGRFTYLRAVPEPTTLSLLALGVMGCGVRRRGRGARRRFHNSPAC